MARPADHYPTRWVSWNVRRWWAPPSPASSAEEAVRQNRPVNPLPTFLFELRVLGQRQWEDTQLVLYEVSERDHRFRRCDWFGFGAARRTSAGWERVAHMGAEYGYDRHTAGWLQAHGASWHYLSPQHTIIVGRVRVPPVARVEVALVTGEVLSDQAGDGLFVLMAPRVVAADELRVFAADGRLLVRHRYAPRHAAGGGLANERHPGRQ